MTRTMWDCGVGCSARTFGTTKLPVYGDTLDKGGAVLAARVPGEQVAKVMALLDVHQPLDVARCRREDRRKSAGGGEGLGHAADRKGGGQGCRDVAAG